MPEKHLSTQFDSELNSVSSRVMELGGLVESQIRQAIYALSQFSMEAVEQVASIEQRVNAMEVEIDHELSSIIARRQPTARDLRLLIAFSKATANLERMGDEACKMARMVKSIIASGAARSLPSGEIARPRHTSTKMLPALMKNQSRFEVSQPRMAVNIGMLLCEAFLLLLGAPHAFLWCGLLTALVIAYNFGSVWAIARVLLPKVFGCRGRALTAKVDGLLGARRPRT